MQIIQTKYTKRTLHKCDIFIIHRFEKYNRLLNFYKSGKIPCKSISTLKIVLNVFKAHRFNETSDVKHIENEVITK